MRDERGIGLIPLMISVTLLSLMVLPLLSLLSNSMKAARRVEVKDSLVSLRRSIRDRLSCTKTLEGQTCSSGTYFDLKDKNGNLLHSPSRQLGMWEVRGSCDGSKLKIERNCPVSQLATLGPATCQGWEDLYPEGDLACQDFFCNASCPPGSPFCQYCGSTVSVLAGPLIRDPNQPECGAAVQSTPPCQSIHWTGNVRCPDGFVAAGGGAYCQVGGNGGVVLHSAPIQDLNTHKPVGWSTDCCVIDCTGVAFLPPGRQPTAVSPLPQGAYAICIPERNG